MSGQGGLGTGVGFLRVNSVHFLWQWNGFSVAEVNVFITGAVPGHPVSVFRKDCDGHSQKERGKSFKTEKIGALLPLLSMRGDVPTHFIVSQNCRHFCWLDSVSW